MKQYETYELAKIENPKSKICKLICEGFVTSGEIARCNFGEFSFVYCDPARYCTSFKELFEQGKKLVDGDIYIGISGHVYTVGKEGVSASDVNNPCDNDDQFFILKSKELGN